MNKRSFNCPGCGKEIKMYSYSSFIICPECKTRIEVKNDIYDIDPCLSMTRTKAKKRRDCPVCRKYRSMQLNEKKTKWQCDFCKYDIPVKEIKKVVFWFCDSCDAFLNVQPGFNDDLKKYICCHCGFENDLSDDNIF